LRPTRISIKKANDIMLLAGASFHGRATHTAPSIRMAVSSWYDSGVRLTSAASDTSMASDDSYPMLGGTNTWHKASGPWPKDEARPWLDESTWPKRWVPAVDYLGRPLEVKLTEMQLAAFGGPEIRPLEYPSLEEETASLKAKAAEREASIAETTAEIDRLNKSLRQATVELSAIEEGLALVAEAQAAPPPTTAPAPKAAPKAAPAKTGASSSAADKTDSPVAIAALGLAAAAGAAYYFYASPAAEVVQSSGAALQ
jgi:hypothetical protein